MMALVAAVKILGYRRGITLSLQSSKINMGVACQEVTNVIEAMSITACTG